MKKKFDYFIFFISFLIIIHFVYQELILKETEREQHSTQEQRQQLGNTRISNFRSAKLIAAKFYERNDFKTFYCECPFSGKTVFLESCSYEASSPYSKRAKRIEWEHVVPASHFGQKIESWKNGHKRCLDSSGKKYKGRNCARLVSKRFRKMEADLYNLVPVIGEVNLIRSNYPFGKNSLFKNKLGNCPSKISGKTVLPRKEIRGLIARIYFYMDHAYPGFDIINSKNKKLLKSWQKTYPPTKHELKRNRYIENAQGNSFYLSAKKRKI